MSLEKYWKKREFKKTPEPKGKVLKTKKHRFVVHDHFAKKARHHHDLRLEMEGVLKSWAVPKGVPIKAGVKRLAIQTEDHPVDYINFEGEIPKGSYGAGRVKIFDRGNCKSVEKEKDGIFFEVKGKKLKGKYSLIKLKGKSDQWLLFKTK